ncbi:DUF4932 domain-containing protein [Chitinophaga qingshengii]|uniref:DUF4932 domain-containing protein n=1 Tax=Chitinophaga qingshengii TaxID=1569794 RepID=A0ABR7TV97_9BACT|nr:DUF4932 domain-containing protein [Chitinophaga qingshengii]MBC9932889.1 DUF4932 domain-containing protein [Chitinophaga qingshengii]
MPKFPLLFVCTIVTLSSFAQETMQLSKKVTLSWNRNIETYFIVEKLAVQHIGHIVFTRKDSVYAHQPLIRAATARFGHYVDSPVVLRMAALLTELREQFHDNAEIVEYVLHQRPFPARGALYPFDDKALLHSDEHPQALARLQELTDSLRSFYQQAGVGRFLQENKRFYTGVLKEAAKYIRPDIFPYMEQYYGEHFDKYALYVMPSMPIPAGDDNYRAFGPNFYWPEGHVSAMVMSVNTMLPVKPSMKDYTTFGYGNAATMQFLTVHEMGHSFVNPPVNKIEGQVLQDTALFTPALQKALEPSYIGSWKTCVIEHLVRLGEIRIAVAMHDQAEAGRLRKMHIGEFHFVLLPLLEEKIQQYEQHRDRYKTFADFLPELLGVFHALTPAAVDRMVTGSADRG